MDDNVARRAELNLQELPGLCATRHPITGQPILISVGETGYYPLHRRFDVDAFNARHGITSAEIFAMELGSMFGWDAPGANPRPH
jgi:hypothetical protein